MSSIKSFIGYPWILDAISKYKGEIFTPKAAPAQVVEFLKMPERSKECQYSGAIVHISDRKYYIRAIITKEAHETMEREDEHFTLANIKNTIIILKKFTLSFAAEEDLRCCEFILTIEHFCVLPMETNTVDILNCNMNPDVQKKIKELWQNYMTELQMKAISDMNSSDVSLTQLLIAANEEKLSSLKFIAEQCLDLDPYATQEISKQARTTWSMKRKNNKNHSVSLSLPLTLLIIPPEEEAALEQMSELAPNNNSTGDADDSSGEEIPSTQYSTAASTLSQESMADACNSKQENPWNNLPSLCATRSTGSAILDSSSSITQQSCEREIALDSDSTPDIHMDYQDHSRNVSTESQDQLPSLLSPELRSEKIPDFEMSTSTHVTESSNSNAGISSSPMEFTDPTLIPHAQDYQEEHLIQVYSSPQKAFAVKSKVQINPLLPQSSESDNNFRLPDNYFTSDSTMSNNSTASRERKAVKRKQSPKDLDSTSSDEEQSIPMCMEKLDCVVDVSRCEKISSVANKSNETQPDIPMQVDKRGRTAQSCLEKEPESRQVVKGICRKTIKARGTSPAQKKALPYKPRLDFVAQPKLKVTKNSENMLPAASTHTSRTPCKEASPMVSRGQISAFQAPVLETKRTKMTHSDGTSFQYKYKAPSADLRARLNALQVPAELCEWAKKILSDAKEKVP